MAITFQPIYDEPFDTVLETFNAGYEGYIVPVELNEAQMHAHIDRYDIDLTASRVAYDKKHTVGIALLGIRGERGWVGGIGIRPAFRRRGYGRLLLESLIEAGRERELERIQLEVIEGNDAAYDMYLKCGFVDKQRLLIVEREAAPLPHSPTDKDSLTIEAAPADDLLEDYERLHQSDNPWQREIDSLHVLAPLIGGWGAWRDGQLAAYALGLSLSSAINWMDMAFAPGEEAALRAVVESVHVEQPEAPARFVNLGANDRVWPVLSAMGYVETMAQTEMWLTL